jgi:hypothetical protein
MVIRMAIGLALGAIAGFVWYKVVGCSTGACPLTSNPLISTAYGAAIGGLIAWK